MGAVLSLVAAFFVFSRRGGDFKRAMVEMVEVDGGMPAGEI